MCPEPMLWESNLRHTELLAACSTQWRVGPMGDRIGLDYQGVSQVAQIYGIELNQEFFSLFQHLEREYLKALADRAKRDATNRH